MADIGSKTHQKRVLNTLHMGLLLISCGLVSCHRFKSSSEKQSNSHSPKQQSSASSSQASQFSSSWRAADDASLSIRGMGKEPIFSARFEKIQAIFSADGLPWRAQGQVWIDLACPTQDSSPEAKKWLGQSHFKPTNPGQCPAIPEAGPSSDRQRFLELRLENISPLDRENQWLVKMTARHAERAIELEIPMIIALETPKEQKVHYGPERTAAWASTGRLKVKNSRALELDIDTLGLFPTDAEGNLDTKTLVELGRKFDRRLAINVEFNLIPSDLPAPTER